MAIKFHLIFLLISALGLVSCASTRGYPEREVSSEDELADLKTDFQTAKTKYSAVTTDEDRIRVRNEIINGRIAAIDIQFSLFQQELHEEGIGLNIGTDAITIGLGAAGALASGGTSQILSGISAAITGLKGSVDKNAFFEQTMPALFAKMIAKRKVVLVIIRTGLNQDTSHYPLQQGLADLEEYRYAGTIPGAISAVVETAGAEATAANKELSTILVSGSEVTPNTITLEEWLSPGGKDDQKHFDMLTNWLKLNKINMFAESFRDDPKMRGQIQQFLDYLKIIKEIQ